MKVPQDEEIEILTADPFAALSSTFAACSVSYNKPKDAKSCKRAIQASPPE
jgi:hypothetical protein